MKRIGLPVMDIIQQLAKAMNLVKRPLTLIAFLSVSAIATFLLALKHTNGLEKAQEMLLKKASFRKGELVGIVNRILYVVLAITAMLFSLLAFDMHNSYLDARVKDEIQQEIIRRSIPCNGETCTGKNPQQIGCASPSTDTIGVSEGSILLNGKPKYVKVQLRYSPLCRSVWMKATKIVGAKIWLEEESKHQLTEPYTIPLSEIESDYHTDMISADIKSRACLQKPGSEPICTGYVKP
jgi:hypothetical protein